MNLHNKPTAHKRTSSFMISPINTREDLSAADDTAMAAATSINIESAFPGMVYRMKRYACCFNIGSLREVVVV